MTRSAPAAVASSSSPAAPSTAAPTPRFKEEELTKAQERCGGADNLVEIPVYISPIAMIYNLDGVENLQLSPETLAKIFKQEIKTWDDAAIKADNPDATLPSTRITVVNRSDESGTTAELHGVPDRRRPGRLDVRARTRSGRSRAARPRRAPPASSMPSRPARARSATPTSPRRASSARPRSRSATRSSRRRPRRPPRSSSSPRRPTIRARTCSPTTSTARRPRPARTRSCSCPTRWPARSTTTPRRARSSRAT